MCWVNLANIMLLVVCDIVACHPEVLSNSPRCFTKPELYTILAVTNHDYFLIIISYFWTTPFQTHLKSATNNAAIKPEASTAPQTSEASSSTQQSAVSSMPQEQPASQQSQEASGRDAVATPGPSQVRQEI